MLDLTPVRFGRTDALVSPVGFGAAGLGNEYDPVDDEQATAVVRHAYDRGITYFDTAAYYGRGLSERRLGTAIGPVRDEVFLATKGGRTDLDPVTGFDFSYRAVKADLESSLRRLATDRVDLYQLHDIEFGDRRQVENDGIGALRDLQLEGKVRFVGITGYPTDLLADIVERHEIDAVLSYSRYNLLDRTLDRRLAPTAMAHDVALINASVLDMGLLSPRGPQPWHPAPARITTAARRAVDAAEEAGVAIAELATAFAHHNPAVTVTLLGASRIASLDQSLDACFAEIDAEALASVTAAIGEDLDLGWISGRPENNDTGALAPDPPPPS